MQLVKTIFARLISLSQRFGRWWLGRFRSYGSRGKAGFGCVSLLASCLLLTMCLAPFTDSDTGADSAANQVTDVDQQATVGIADTSISETDTQEELTTPTASTTPTPAIDGQTAVVTQIIDGDTIEVEINGQTHRVRYIGMDTPERGDTFYNEATAANRQLVEGETVILVKDVSETDRYNRLLRYVYLPDGTFVNAELVRQGNAQVATFPPDVVHQELFIELQQEARDNQVGLWSQDVVVAAPTSTASATPQLTQTPTPRPTATATPIPQPTQTTAPTQPAPTATQQPTVPPPTPTQAPPTQPPAAPGDVQITFIFFDGVVSRVESDEYAVITNQGGSPVNLGGWRLNAGDPGQDFGFPNVELQPDQSCRVYTNENHPEHCGFSFGSGRAIWNNGGDCGYLYDNTGAEVSRYCY